MAGRGRDNRRSGQKNNSTVYYAKSQEIPKGSQSSRDRDRNVVEPLPRHSTRSHSSSRSSSSRDGRRRRTTEDRGASRGGKRPSRTHRSSQGGSGSGSGEPMPRHSNSSHHHRDHHDHHRHHHHKDDNVEGGKNTNGSNNNNKSAATQALADYQNRWMARWNVTGCELDGLDQDERECLLPALAWRSYHLPGNECMADWCQYFANNHPVFGICCHHPLHPIRWHVRIMHLLGSFIFGLLITNMIWLWFLYDEDHSEEAVILTVSVNGDVVNVTNMPNVEEFTEQTELQLTEGMALLWTVGSGCHALFDNCIWYLTACICCLEGQSLESLARYKKYGIGLVVFTVICIAAVATFVVVLRATLQDEENAAQELQDLENIGLYDGEGIDTFKDIEDKSDFNFLISYCVELALALFVYYPIVATILFSGMLGCGRVPVLGGRPYEVRLEQVHLREQEEALAEAHRQAEEVLERQEMALSGS